MGSIVKNVVGSFTGSTGAAAAGQAADVQAAASREAVAEQRRQFDISQGQLQPFLEAGTGALQTQQALLGQLGPEAAAAAQEQFQESPGQAFLRNRQEQSLLRNQAAIGGLGGGNIRTALQEQAAGIASTQFGEFQNRLAGLSGTGQTTATTLGQLGAQAASGIGQTLQATGQAQASGILGAQQARAQGAKNIIGLGTSFLSDVRLKKNLVKVGTLPSGLDWFEWEWTEEGKALAVKQSTEGVIAQEAEKIFPDAVAEDENGYLRVDYKRLH